MKSFLTLVMLSVCPPSLFSRVAWTSFGRESCHSLKLAAFTPLIEKLGTSTPFGAYDMIDDISVSDKPFVRLALNVAVICLSSVFPALERAPAAALDPTAPLNTVDSPTAFLTIAEKSLPFIDNACFICFFKPSAEV